MATTSGVLSSKAEVQNVHFVAVEGGGSHREVGGFDVSVEESDVMDALNGLYHLMKQPHGGVGGEGALRLTAPQIGQVAALERHEDIVEGLVSAASNELAHVVSALKLLQHCNLHLQNLFGLLCAFQFHSNYFFGSAIQRTVYLS